ncbi:hypothetical protein BO71DRAFT_189109 [Aspergillus ellipticus CBS 707.79]|uniref:Uncharacterized protein n=1 Tax=Aspergillus ellipticus CBS 707.79 TaxID=1448320 RepID=A0A319DEV8_9EURO|nr:hypothetical protein BO71DRAFT_189109 [Aspergillus ellipticus CBS 707.79]
MCLNRSGLPRQSGLFVWVSAVGGKIGRRRLFPPRSTSRNYVLTRQDGVSSDLLSWERKHVVDGWVFEFGELQIWSIENMGFFLVGFIITVGLVRSSVLCLVLFLLSFG